MHQEPMTVADLRNELAQFDDNALVFVESPSHDHWRTMLAEPVDEVEKTMIGWSSYHDKFQIVDEEQDEFGTDEGSPEAAEQEIPEVVVLRI